MKRVQIALAVIFLLLMSCDNVFHTLANKDPNKDNSIIIGVEGGIIVKFDKNGGETEADPDAIIVWAPVRTIGGLPVDPAWTDYTFLGWNTMPDGTGTGFTSSTTVLSDIVVYAQWVLNTYTVSFYANGASGNAPPAQTVDAASAITLPDEGGLSKPGYFFGGWNTKEDGSGINCSANSLLIVTGSLSLYALWVEIGTVTHTVLFDSNGGTAVPGQIVISGNQAARPQNPSRSGYSFVNWYSDSGLGAVYDFSAPVTENITLFAGWNIVQYTVTFNINGAEGTVPESRTVNAGSEIILPDNTGISKGDYLFGGWNANAAGTGINYSAHGVLVPDSTITLYAKWNPPGTVTHTVSFDSNGGSAVSGQTVISGLSAKRPSDPVRTNYIFSNWYGDDSLASLYSFSNPVTEDITVYAKWNRIQYTVRFSVNGGSGTSPADIIADAGSGITLPDAGGFSRIGYTFGGWNIMASGAGINYDAGASYEPHGNITLYAMWIPIAYTIMYDKNAAGATGTVESSEHIYDVDKALSANAFSLTGHTFVGWKTHADGPVSYADNESVRNLSATDGDTVTLYAGWNINVYTVTFNSNSGNSVAPQHVQHGSAVSRPANPGRNHYSFTNWYGDSGLTVVYNFSTPVTDNITLYAGWVINRYTVTFDTNGAAGTAPVSRTEDALTIITLPGGSGLSKDDFIFAGWNADASGTGRNYSEGESYTMSGNVTLYARWNPLANYTVTYNINEGSGNAPSSRTELAGTPIALPDGTGFSRIGFTFTGWSTSASGTGSYYSAGDQYLITGDATLYARWTVNTYTVIFISNGGSVVTDQNVQYNSRAQRPNNPTRVNYTFDNWYSNSDLTYLYNFDTPVTGNITLYARWTAEIVNPTTYTVTFNSNGGSIVQNQIVNQGATASQPPNPTRTGYTFNDWYSDSGLTTVYNFSASVTSSITLYAKWDAIPTYTVTFNSNGGSIVQNQTVNQGAAASRPTNPTRDGYAFDNWYSDTGLTTAYIFSTPVTGDITLHAKWITQYTVTFNSNEGSNVLAQAVNEGTVASRPPNPTRTGYTFNDWYSDSGLTIVYNFSTSVTSNITLYAKWDAIPTYTVTFNSNGGSIVSNQIVNEGTAVLQPANPTRDGYAFGNWYSDSGLTAVYNFSTSVTSNITLYAKWITQYTVTFNSNGGSIVSNQTVNEGTAVLQPANPTRDGYAFGNWYSDSGLTAVYNFSTPVTGDITLHAKWITQYTVTFNSNEGSNVTAQAVNEGTAASRPANPTRDGYAFDNWYSDTGLTTAYIFSTPVTGDITLHAKWITQYTVTFNSNGGSSVSNQTVNEGVAASRPANPTRAGYTFNDWYSDSGLTIVYNFSTSVTSNITLYAKWDAIPTYTVTFNSNGGSSISNQTVNEGATASRPLPPPILAGYIFDDWYSDSGLTTVYNFSTTITNNTTLYAKWIIIPPVSFTITFDSHGGSHIDPITVTNIPIVLPEPTRQGYEFIAWYVSEGVVFDVDTALDGDITVYALWKINF